MIDDAPEDRRRPAARRRLRSWLKTDEHALAGGLAAKLSEAEGRAIKLLTPPKPLRSAATHRSPDQARLEAGRMRAARPD